ncbi:hypothetical protein [Candidatus Neptunichlamydia sp. REUL1]|uniref:hypothetical protein n=1 Tax=Candidatus Neptunichlamydia sp. REUL1 TaxID=3064277 RepID=UPI00293132F2|nr:hypothetical protein [Candidatus Neptunochlamydia sp. REUL1]
MVEFGLRRAQGIDGALSAARASFVGGCHSTSNILAGNYFGIPVKGTHAHSWIMAFDKEEDAFKAYADAMPNDCIYLVDTYNTIKGVKKAIAVAKTKKEKMLGRVPKLPFQNLAHLYPSVFVFDLNNFTKLLSISTTSTDEKI